jgi:hypothetical protein
VATQAGVAPEPTRTGVLLYGAMRLTGLLIAVPAGVRTFIGRGR